jgi:hypothetical protein
MYSESSFSECAKLCKRMSFSILLRLPPPDLQFEQYAIFQECMKDCRNKHQEKSEGEFDGDSSNSCG